jgi:hypothetical protein
MHFSVENLQHEGDHHKVLEILKGYTEKCMTVSSYVDNTEMR